MYEYAEDDDFVYRVFTEIIIANYTPAERERLEVIAGVY